MGIVLGPDAPGPEPEGIWAENLPALDAFLALCSQWRVAATPGGTRPLALDYAAAPAAFALSGITVDPETWGRMRIIEQGALAALNGD